MLIRSDNRTGGLHGTTINCGAMDTQMMFFVYTRSAIGSL